MASLAAQTVKNLPAMQETWVQSLGQDPLEKEMATQSSILAWRIPWTEDPGKSMGLQRVGHNRGTKTHTCYTHTHTHIYTHTYTHIYIYITESLCCTAEINTTLINSTSI